MYKEILAIQDEHITIEENVRKERLGKQICLVYTGTLDYQPTYCVHCRKENQKSIVRNGWIGKDVTIQINQVSEYKTFLKLKKRVFLCKACKRTFVAQSEIIQKNCQITQAVKLKIAKYLKLKMDLTLISKLCEVSTSSVYRVLEELAIYHKVNYHYLPEILSIDEFHSTNREETKMSFIFQDTKERKIIDIVANRHQDNIIKYFLQYDRKARLNVKLITMDMYKPYLNIIKKCFPNAEISIDRFHIVQHINRAFNQTRIQVMNTFRKNEPKKYRRLKNNWKLLQMDSDKLNYSDWKPRQSFSWKQLSQKAMIDEMLSYSPELKQHYEYYQEILGAIKTKDIELFDELIKENVNQFNNRFQTVIRTYRYYKKQIHNALIFPYSNGSLEATNNIIKSIKRFSFGFRNFANFRKRIFLILNNS
ncbi:Transposase [Pilibacter termitis]|uniref:Transposase n=1 Tax=Pilibacter termitis TaxID=263852 RepID=A0A1T4NFA6_9ENTE|nr:ISL3 family transposase [Pilibacter termitis]SJZ77949.1 Transposase [Pilibacter termitis]